MTVTVLLFASYADALGRSSLDVSVDAGATVGELVRTLTQRPGAETLPPTPVIAVNQVYASYDQRLAHGDEVAVIPPVAGG